MRLGTQTIDDNFWAKPINQGLLPPAGAVSTGSGRFDVLSGFEALVEERRPPTTPG